MRYGVTIDAGGPVPDFTEQVREVAAAGIQALGTSQIFGYDALTLLAVTGQQVPDVELITAVVPTYPRHPYMLAAQALTVQAVTDGRLTLGIGLSHKPVVEGVWGLSFDQPLRHVREYLEVLMPLLHGEGVSFQGETLQVASGPLGVVAPAPDVIVAALGPQMLELTVPTINASASAAGRPKPRVMVSLPVNVTDDVDAARARAEEMFALYGRLPSYRAMLDREGAAGPGDVAVVGDEELVATQLARFADAGATDFLAAPFGRRPDRDRTVSLLAELARKPRSTP